MMILFVRSCREVRRTCKLLSFYGFWRCGSVMDGNGVGSLLMVACGILTGWIDGVEILCFASILLLRENW